MVGLGSLGFLVCWLVCVLWVFSLGVCRLFWLIVLVCLRFLLYCFLVLLKLLFDWFGFGVYYVYLWFMDFGGLAISLVCEFTFSWSLRWVLVIGCGVLCEP